MTRRWHRLLLVLGSLAGIVVASGILRARESRYALPPVSERLMYLQSGKVADRLSLSFDAVVADVYWIRTIQHYGRDFKNVNRPNRFELLYPLLDLTTTLDPKFLIAYRFGAVFLASQPPEGPGRVDQAIALLEKGLKANPDRWQLAHDVAFTHYLYTGDYAAAADWFRRAGAMPKAPGWLIFRDECGVGDALAARLRGEGEQVFTVEAGARFESRDDRGFVIDPRRPDDYQSLLEALSDRGFAPGHVVHLWGVTRTEEPAGASGDDGRLRKQGEQPARGHGDHALHEEGEGDTHPHQQRPVARRQDERRHEGLVRQLDREDEGERRRHDRQVHHES